jgi:hypothetical protein
MDEADLKVICSLPSTFKHQGIGWRQLVLSSPYSRSAAQLDESFLAAFLRGHPALIELWLAWSEDKRSSPSWFFRRVGSRYECGFVGRDGSVSSQEVFDEPAPPCARFILHELAGTVK